LKWLIDLQRNFQKEELMTNMKKAIMATLYHYYSINKQPRHENCPMEAESWREWRKAEARGEEKNYDHPSRIITDIEKHLIPICEKLSKEEFLTRCLDGYMQNSNESFNSTIWRLAPKHLNSDPKIIEIATFIAADISNEGYSTILQTMMLLEINIGQQYKMFADEYDEEQITRQEWRRLCSTKEARIVHRLDQIQQNKFYEEADGLLYESGIAD